MRSVFENLRKLAGFVKSLTAIKIRPILHIVHQTDTLPLLLIGPLFL